MFAIILKELHTYTNTRKYLVIQLIVLSLLVSMFYLVSVESYAQAMNKHHISLNLDVGKRTYTIFIFSIFMTILLVPKHAVESVYMERSSIDYRKHQNISSINAALLRLTPIANWKILCGKFAAVVLWGISGICLTIPIFFLSIFLGGLPLIQIVRCGAVIFVSCIFFVLIGIGFATWQTPIRAIGISYGIILTFIFLPMLPIMPFAAIPKFDVLSPLSALLSILQSDTTQPWIWNICLLGGLSLLIFPILVRYYR